MDNDTAILAFLVFSIAGILLAIVISFVIASQVFDEIWQHQRQKRKLTEQEWLGVPDGAIEKPQMAEDMSDRAVSVAVTRQEGDKA